MEDMEAQDKTIERPAGAAPETVSGGAAEGAAFYLRAFTALVGREFTAYFKSTMAYLVLFFFFLASGTLFWITFRFLNQERMPPTEFPMQPWFGSVLLFAFTVIIPAVTMRLVAEEMKAGTLECLATAPVTTFQIVFSKFLAAFGFYLVMLVPTLLYAVILDRTAQPVHPDRGPIAAGYLGLLCIGAYFLAIGTFATVCTRNQIVAFLGAFLAILVLNLVSMARRSISGEAWREALKPFDFGENFMDFGRGVIDTRHIVYYFAMTALLLFLSVGVLEFRKWKL
jgi:ABC-2 type transport system permease protein